MKNFINIGIPSKGRLRKDVLKIFNKKKLRLISERGERDLIGSIKNKENIKILYLHAREIIERLGDGSLDIGFSGFDLLKESEINVQSKINVIKKFDFGKANLVVAIPDPWIDVQTIADLEEIAFEFRDNKKKRIIESSDDEWSEGDEDEEVTVDLQHEKIHAEDCEQCETREGKVDKITKTIKIKGDCSEDQERRLLEIAEKCPVNRTLKSEIVIESNHE